MINSFQNYWQWRKEHSKRTKGYLSIILMLTLKETANARMQNSNRNNLPYARHYNPRFVYFLPTSKTFFQGAFFLKFWPYVWLVFKSGFKSRAGYDGARTVTLSQDKLAYTPPQGQCLK